MAMTDIAEKREKKEFFSDMEHQKRSDIPELERVVFSWIEEKYK